MAKFYKFDRAHYQKAKTDMICSQWIDSRAAAKLLMSRVNKLEYTVLILFFLYAALLLVLLALVLHFFLMVRRGSFFSVPAPLCATAGGHTLVDLWEEELHLSFWLEFGWVESGLVIWGELFSLESFKIWLNVKFV